MKLDDRQVEIIVNAKIAIRRLADLCGPSGPLRLKNVGPTWTLCRRFIDLLPRLEAELRPHNPGLDVDSTYDRTHRGLTAADHDEVRARARAIREGIPLDD